MTRNPPLKPPKPSQPHRLRLRQSTPTNCNKRTKSRHTTAANDERRTTTKIRFGAWAPKHQNVSLRMAAERSLLTVDVTFVVRRSSFVVRRSSFVANSSTTIRRPSVVHPSSIRRSSPIRRPSVDHPSIIRRPSVVHPSTICRPSVDHPSSIRLPSVIHPSFFAHSSHNRGSFVVRRPPRQHFHQLIPPSPMPSSWSLPSTLTSTSSQLQLPRTSVLDIVSVGDVAMHVVIHVHSIEVTHTFWHRRSRR